MFERTGHLTGHDLGDLTRLKVRDFDLPSVDFYARTGGVDPDIELCAFDDSCKVRRFDSKVFDVAFFDLQQDRTGLLHNGCREAVILFGWQTHYRIWRDQDGFGAARQQRAAVSSSADGITSFQNF